MSNASNGAAVSGTISRYLPFGDWRTEPTAGLTDKGYTGHTHNNLGNGNNDIGLIYMNARFYVPSLARFASADTMIPDHTNPQDWNRFSYVRNSPFNYTDPTGHVAQKTRNGGNCATEGNICTSSSEWGGPVYPPGHPEAGQSIPNPVEVDSATKAIIMIASFVPGVGEVIDAIDIASAVKDGNYDEAAFILAVMALPGSAKVLREGGSGAVRAIKGVDDDIVQAMMRTLDNLCSFSEDTLVMTEEGLMPISEVDVGELVLAFNEATGEIGYYPVTATWAHLDPIIVELTIDGEVVWTTPEHPFYTADGDWEAVFELQVGEEIQQADGTTGVVEGVVYHARPQMMYNMTVATAHTYFVGDGHWLVHNACEAFANTANLALRQLSPELRGVTIAMSLDDAGQPILAVYGRTGQITEDAVASLRRKGWNVLDAPPRGSAYHAERQLYDEGYTQIGISRQRGMCSSCEDFFNDKPHVTVTEYSPP